MPPRAPKPGEVILPPEIVSRLADTPEQRETVGPMVLLLSQAGWSLDQMQFGRREWRVPKAPNEATKRERGQSFEGFPVDIAVFDSARRVGEPQHLLFIVEAKRPDDPTGADQLETYLSREPHVRLGVRVDRADLAAPATFCWRMQNGTLERRDQLVADMPRPGEPVEPRQQRVTFADLKVPNEALLRRTISDLLDRVVIEDPNVNRREDQLDQLCSILLLKLNSDKRAKFSPDEPPQFRPLESPARTAEEVRRDFTAFTAQYPETFRTQRDRELRLADQTIHLCVELLYRHRIIDMGVATVSLGFQVLRAEALKQGEGQYFTPQPVIEAGVRLLEIGYDDLVVDPACGTGGFLVEVLLEMQRRNVGEPSEVSRWAQTHIYGIDKDAIGVKLTKAIMQIAGDGSAHCVRGDAVRTHAWQTDFPHLEQPFERGRFTVVVTNPPFGVDLKVSARDCRLSELSISLAAGRGSYVPLEIGLVYLERAYTLLRPGGRLGIVLPETYFFSPSYSWLFDWMEGKFRPLVVADVPMDAFQGFCRAKTNFYVFRRL